MSPLFFFLLISSFSFASCNLQVPLTDNVSTISAANDINVTSSFQSRTEKEELVFNRSIVYKLDKNDGEPQELTFFINKTGRIILYTPLDDMIDAVISYPTGLYQIMGKDENGKPWFREQMVDITSERELYREQLTRLENTKLLVVDAADRKTIESIGYRMQYIDSNESDEVYITRALGLNAYQLFGFAELEGDAQIPELHFFNILHSSEWLTYCYSKYATLELIHYGSDQYFISPDDYRKKN